MKTKIILGLIIILLISGCGDVEPIPTAEVVAEIEPPKEPVKTYKFSIEGKEVDNIMEICSITSRVENLDSVSHRYHLNSYIIINGVRKEVGEEFNLDAGKVRMVTRDLKCPSGSENTVNSEVREVK